MLFPITAILIILTLLSSVQAYSDLISEKTILENDLTIILYKTNSSQMAGYIEITFTDDSLFNDSFKVCYFIKDNSSQWIFKACYTMIDDIPSHGRCYYRRTVKWKIFTFEVYPCSICYKVVITPLGNRPLISIYFGEIRLISRVEDCEPEWPPEDGEGKSLGYWKHNVRVYVEGQGSYSGDPHETNATMEEYEATIQAHAGTDGIPVDFSLEWTNERFWSKDPIDKAMWLTIANWFNKAAGLNPYSNLGPIKLGFRGIRHFLLSPY